MEADARRLQLAEGEQALRVPGRHVVERGLVGELEPDPLQRRVEVPDVDIERAALVGGTRELVHDGRRRGLRADPEHLPGLHVRADLDEQLGQAAVQILEHGVGA